MQTNYKTGRDYGAPKVYGGEELALMGLTF